MYRHTRAPAMKRGQINTLGFRTGVIKVFQVNYGDGEMSVKKNIPM